MSDIESWSEGSTGRGAWRTDRIVKGDVPPVSDGDFNGVSLFVTLGVEVLRVGGDGVLCAGSPLADRRRAAAFPGTVCRIVRGGLDTLRCSCSDGVVVEVLLPSVRTS